MSKLKDKIAIVTGASKGIGASIARHLANEGAAVVVNYASSKQDAERAVADITRGGGRAIAVQGNVARQADVDRLFAINPGTVETEGVHAAGFIGSDFMKDAIAKTPLGRIGQPQDIAPVAVFLASSDGAWVTGETLAVSGGLR